MTWQGTKTDWTSNDGVADTDVNKWETNTQANYNERYRGLSSYTYGFNIKANVGSGAYVFSIGSGRFLVNDDDSVDPGAVYNTATLQKVFSSTNWAAGTGSSSPCKVPGVTFANDAWFFVFVIYNPNTEAVDIAVDDNVYGTNLATSTIVTSSGYSIYRFVAPIKTSSLLTTNGIVPCVSQNGRFYLAGTPASPRTDTIVLNDTSVTSWTLEDANSVGLFPLVPGTTNQQSIRGNILLTPNLRDQCEVWPYALGSAGSGGGLGARVPDLGTSIINSLNVDIMPDEFNRIYIKSTQVTSGVTWTAIAQYFDIV